jgi:glycosyltransferase involved in cell wall biosynthesis
MPDPPTISIVTPCYNSVPFLERIHGSLARQSFRGFEWICVDDCSTDDTVDRLASLPSPGALGMQVYRLPQNTYGPVAIAVGTQLAKGDVVLWLDHDDELTPNALETIARHWPKVGDHAGLIFSVIDPKTGERYGGQLPVGEAFTMREFTARSSASDVALALKREVAQRHATIESMEPVALLGVPLHAMAASGRFLVCDGALKIYHRDNGQSQTSLERISRKTVTTYARLLDGGFFSGLAWVKSAATLLRFSRQVHGRWFAGLRDCRLRTRLSVAAIWPLGVLALWRRPHANVVEYPLFRPEMAEGLPDLWRGQKRSNSPCRGNSPRTARR